MTDQHPKKNHDPDAVPEPADQTDATDVTDNKVVDWQRPETWPREIGGNRGPEPTRYGDWESNGRCTDF